MRRWDDGAHELFGHAAGQVLGQRVDFLIPAHLRGAHWHGFTRVMSQPEVKDMRADMPVLCADGRIRSIAGRLLVLSDRLSQAVGAVAIFTDGGSVGFDPFG